MPLTRPLCALLAPVSLALLPLAVAPGASSPGPGAVLAMHAALLAALDQGDAARAGAFVAGGDQPTLFLVDQLGRPETRQGHDRVAAAISAWARAEGLGWKSAVTPVRADCPSGELSFAILRIERSRPRGTEQELASYLSTSLVRHEKDGWKLLHWHLSPAEPAGGVVRAAAR